MKYTITALLFLCLTFSSFARTIPYVSDKRLDKIHQDLSHQVQLRLDARERGEGEFDDLIDTKLIEQVLKENLPPQLTKVKVLLKDNHLIVRVAYKTFLWKPLIRIEGELKFDEENNVLIFHLLKANFETAFSIRERMVKGMQKIALDYVHVVGSTAYIDLF